MLIFPMQLLLKKESCHFLQFFIYLFYHLVKFLQYINSLNHFKHYHTYSTEQQPATTLRISGKQYKDSKPGEKDFH